MPTIEKKGGKGGKGVKDGKGAKVFSFIALCAL